MKKKKKQAKTTRKSPDFSLEDILNAPQLDETHRHTEGLGCNKCGSLKIISRGEVRVFRGQRMKVYHCHDCGQDFYKGK